MSESNRSDGLVRIKQTFPLTGKGPTAVSHLVLKILETDKFVQKITLEVGKPALVETLVSAESSLLESDDPHDIVRNRTMLEYAPEGEKNIYQQLIEMYKLVTDEGLKVTHFMAGNLQRFTTALKVPMRTTELFAIPLVAVSPLPSDVFLVCGALEFPAEYRDIRLSVKGVLP